MTDRRSHGSARATLYRDAPDWEGRRCAAIGGFRCGSAQDGATLLNAIAAEMTDEGIQALLGPMDGDTWHSYRLVTESDGTPPFLMEPTSGPEDHAAFKAAGFTPVARYFSARMSLSASGAIQTQPGDQGDLLIETWDGTDPEGHFSHVFDLSVRAFADNSFYKPIARKDFLAMYMPFVPMLRPELILMARDRRSGDLLGFLFGIPNYQEGRSPSSVILKTYASLRPGTGHALSARFFSAARGMGYSHAIHALIAETNTSAERSRALGAEVFRRYALMGRQLIP